VVLVDLFFSNAVGDRESAEKQVARDLLRLAESILSIGDPAKREELIKNATSILINCPLPIIWPSPSRTYRALFG